MCVIVSAASLCICGLRSINSGVEVSQITRRCWKLTEKLKWIKYIKNTYKSPKVIGSCQNFIWLTVQINLRVGGFALWVTLKYPAANLWRFIYSFYWLSEAKCWKSSWTLQPPIHLLPTSSYSWLGSRGCCSLAQQEQPGPVTSNTHSLTPFGSREPLKPTENVLQAQNQT